MMNRPTVCLTLLPIHKTITVKAGSSLLEALRRAGVEIAAPCNGHGLCGKCKVEITAESPPLETPHPHLRPDEISAGIRLACDVEVYDGMKIILPEDHALDTRILEGERIQKSRVAPAAVVEKINERFMLRYENLPPVQLSSWREALSPKGLAVDIGTTTIVASLFDLLSGRELATSSSINPQTRFGHDVMTRIRYASTPEGLKAIADVTAEGLNALIGKLCQDAGAHFEEIVDAVIGGNTTMLQLAAAIDPKSLGRAPFAVSMESGCSYPVQTFRLKMNQRGRVYIPPVAHAFVGSDISAGLLSTVLFSGRTPLLFMDLGTNGEIVLIGNGYILLTSTAVGPAFEGMGITHGMQAVAGAIETVWTNEKYFTLRTIDNAPARGICGSGIVDIVAGLIEGQNVEPNGRLIDPKMKNSSKGPFADRYEKIDSIAAIRLTDRVYFTQKDLRSFQLAKSAVKTGVEMLLAAAGLNSMDLQEIVIAGAFGYHLREESLRKINILPRGFKGKIDFAGNTSRTGCVLLLVDAANRQYLEEQMGMASYLSLPGEPDFQTQFVANLPFL